MLRNVLEYRGFGLHFAHESRVLKHQRVAGVHDLALACLGVALARRRTDKAIQLSDLKSNDFQNLAAGDAPDVSEEKVRDSRNLRILRNQTAAGCRDLLDYRRASARARARTQEFLQRLSIRVADEMKLHRACPQIHGVGHCRRAVFVDGSEDPVPRFQEAQGKSAATTEQINARRASRLVTVFLDKVPWKDQPVRILRVAERLKRVSDRELFGQILRQ
jgi:hypothetical protein